MPKGNIFSKFARRKSAGNELDAQYERANVKPEEEKTVGSFRVIPRPNRYVPFCLPPSLGGVHEGCSVHLRPSEGNCGS